MFCVVGLAEVGEVDVLGGGEEFLEGWVELGDRQVLEDAAAVVVDQDDGQVSDEFVANQEAVGVVEQG